MSIKFTVVPIDGNGNGLRSIIQELLSAHSILLAAVLVFVTVAVAFERQSDVPLRTTNTFI